MNKKQQPWIYSSLIDSVFILSPPFICLIIIYSFLDFFQSSEINIIAWVILILLIDVAHVYTTLYRTYFDKETFLKNKPVLLNAPLICFIIGVIVYETDPLLFWRLLAYLAVFHFIRQQYGFMRIYSRKESFRMPFNRIDNFAIYYATIYPIIYWHTHAPKNFHWFIEGDFYYFNNELINILSLVLYIASIALYLAKEAYVIYSCKQFNLPKNLIIAGTYLSWYFGIVYFNADLIFTTLNVVSHGIPYMALVWIYGRKKYGNAPITSSEIWKKVFKGYGLPLFVTIVFMLAYVEEGFWDGLIWKEHSEFFPWFSSLPLIKDKHLMALIVPLLSLPQISHYVLDGFIWKISKDKFNWKKSTF